MYDGNNSSFREIVALYMTETQQLVLRKKMIRAFGFAENGTRPKTRKPIYPVIKKAPAQTTRERQLETNGNGYRSVTVRHQS